MAKKKAAPKRTKKRTAKRTAKVSKKTPQKPASPKRKATKKTPRRRATPADDVATNDRRDADLQDSYRRRKDRAAKRDREEATAGKDIGPLPGVVRPRRKANCKYDLLKFLLTYAKESFPLDFSADQLDFIAAVEAAILKGGARAQAMPRGSGKTTIILWAICWALAYGHRRFVVLAAAEQEAADELCDDFRVVWETNDRLLEDFPEVAHPIRALEGTVQRAKAQMLDGRQTFLRWSGSKLVMPTVPGSAASGSVLRAKGLLGRLRGMKSTTPQGDTIRPDLVLVEDFQTDASSDSDVQCAKRERTIAGAVLGLAGPGKRIAAFATCTVIRWGDAADRILNRKLYPKWKGRRCKLVNKWPDDYEKGDGHWAKYAEIRDAELEAGDDEHPKATRYYKRHRKAMDAGADIPWAARKFDHELSAVEHAVNLRADNPDTFDAEYQNEPKDEVAATGDIRVLTSDEFCTDACLKMKRYVVPDETETLTMGWDVQDNVLFYVVVAVSQHFGGHVVDYGSWPKQPTGYFSAAEVPKTIYAATKLTGREALHKALSSLKAELMDGRYVGSTGEPWKPERGLVDAGYKTQTVYAWTRDTDAPVLACMGHGVTAKKVPWDQVKQKKGERTGLGWRLPSISKTGSARRCDIDTNTWKTDLQRRFALPPGAVGRWTVFKRSPAAHRLWADHMSAEYPTKTQGQGRELFEWEPRPGRENHLLDCMIYAAVAANLAGVKHPDQPEKKKRRRKPPKNHGDRSRRDSSGRSKRPTSLKAMRAKARAG